jgi:hypothetical protein
VGSDHGDPGAHLRRWVGTTPPARWWNPTSVPSIQVSCRCEIAEHSNYNFISRSETEKLSNFCTGRNRVGHQEGKLRERLLAWRQQFRLSEEIRAGTGGRETACDRRKKIDYQRIMAMGPDVIRFILRDLAKRPAHWFWALHNLVPAGQDPAEGLTTMEEARQAWLKWGRENKYL